MSVQTEEEEAVAQPISQAEVAEVVREVRRNRLGQSTPAWLLRLMVESSFIMLSILLALAVDNWREALNNRKLAQKSLQIFEREIKKNIASLEGVAPYHKGLRSIVAEAQSDPNQSVDIRTIFEGITPTLLLSTAWETSMATGALTHIDVETVSALSLTYSVQERFRESARETLPSPATGALDPAQRARVIRDANTYLTQLVTAEEDLLGYYRQALQIIDSTLARPPNR